MVKRLTKGQRRRRAYNRRYRLEHHAEIQRKRRAYRVAHRKEIAKSHLEWEHAHPEKMAVYRRKKNARRRRLRREARRLLAQRPRSKGEESGQ
jgi:hypothetical protein